jgi:starch phosphorylase
VPHLSVLDGWWAEGYNGRNGWAIGEHVDTSDPAQEDAQDAESLYRILEEQVVPLYYDRDRRNIPHGWLDVCKESIAAAIPAFSTRRMLWEYVERLYLPAAQQARDRVGT